MEKKLSRKARFCGWLLKKLGWTSVGGPMKEKKAIVLGVPHTTVWDFLISYLFYTQFDKTAHIMIKKEFFFWPLGPILKSTGAIPVDRSSPATMVRSLITEMEKCAEFHLAIAQEGDKTLEDRLSPDCKRDRGHSLCRLFLLGKEKGRLRRGIPSYRRRQSRYRQTPGSL